ncbi:MAG: hypothetical protein WAL71_13095 [Terriglobales bacterium]
MTTSIKHILAVTLVAALALLAGARPRSPKEIVTHRICYTDDAGNRTCE